jgi:hypothetical protein
MSKLAERIARTNSKDAWKAKGKCKLGNKFNLKKQKPWPSNYPMDKGQKQTRKT